MANLLRLVVLLALARPQVARADARRVYEEKCLYCHSAKRTEILRLRPGQWRRLVERMRTRSPLLISRRDVDFIVRYLVNDLRLVPSRVARPNVAVGGGPPTTPSPPPLAATTLPPAPLEPGPAPPPPAPQGADLEPTSDPEPVSSAPVPEPEDAEAEEQGPVLLTQKCSKCHTIYRVFTKIDSRALGEVVVERMRRKTGSGISPDDARMLLRFIASRANL